MPRVDGGIGFEWRTEAEFYGYPLICVAVGRSDKGSMRVARGWVAVGQFAVGAVTFAQFGAGLVFGLGQFMASPVAVGQFALGIIFGLGQFATGYAAVGQIAFGYYVICQSGFGWHAIKPGYQDPRAVEFFARWAQQLGLPLFGGGRHLTPERTP